MTKRKMGGLTFEASGDKRLCVDRALSMSASMPAEFSREIHRAARAVDTAVNDAIERLAEAAVMAACPASVAAQHGVSEEEARRIIAKTRMAVVTDLSGARWVELDGKPFAGMCVRVKHEVGRALVVVEPIKPLEGP